VLLCNDFVIASCMFVNTRVAVRYCYHCYMYSMYWTLPFLPTQGCDAGDSRTGNTGPGGKYNGFRVRLMTTKV